MAKKYAQPAISITLGTLHVYLAAKKCREIYSDYKTIKTASSAVKDAESINNAIETAIGSKITEKK